MPRAPWQERAFRILLRLFPSEFRGDFGEQMTQDFRDQRQDARGRLAATRLWASTGAGFLRQAPREHLDMLARDLRHAIRLLCARGWRAGLAVGLLAVAIAANALLFATADSLVFARVPYPNARELVELQRIDPDTRQPTGGSFLSPALLDEWRTQTDIFAAVHGHLYKVIFVTGAGEPELVPAADVTVGLIDALGMRPRWGRSLFPGDERPADAQAVLIAESLARERFGDPAAAVDGLLPTTAAPLRVVGVMPEPFRFPRGDVRIWRALDPRGPLAEGFVGVSSIARLAPGLSLPIAAPLIEARSVAVGEAAGAPAGYAATLGIPLIAGRMFGRGEPPTNVIITETLARRLWPDGNAVGGRFREIPLFPWYHVIGVVPHVRTLHDTPAGPDRYFQLYIPRQPPPPAATASQPNAGMTYGFLTVTARVHSRSTAGDLYQITRAVDPHNILRIAFVDDLYASQHAARLLAARIVSGFGLLAFLVAAAGVFGLMSFLVASREREFGIHVALGADAQDVRRIVLDSALRLAAIGGVLGVGLALVAGRWMESQLFGVTAADPTTFVGVLAVVLATTVLAAWPPARRATRVDPTLLLKS